MLTGDNRRTAGAIAAQLGLDEVKAELLPQDKVKAIRDYRRLGHVVAMVGDGINDTPALAEADLGVAMGAAGTDAAIETADLTLMSDNLKRLVRALHLGKATLNNIRQNVALAVAVVLLLVLGVLGQKVFLAFRACWPTRPASCWSSSTPCASGSGSPGQAEALEQKTLLSARSVFYSLVPAYFNGGADEVAPAHMGI